MNFLPADQEQRNKIAKAIDELNVSEQKIKDSRSHIADVKKRIKNTTDMSVKYFTELCKLRALSQDSSSKYEQKCELWDTAPAELEILFPKTVVPGDEYNPDEVEALEDEATSGVGSTEK